MSSSSIKTTQLMRERNVTCLRFNVQLEGVFKKNDHRIGQKPAESLFCESNTAVGEGDP